MRHLILKEWRENLWPFLISVLVGGLGALAFAPDRLAGDKPWALVFVLASVAAMLTAQCVSGEVELGTLTILMTRPIARRRIWLAKYLASLALVLECALFLAVLGAMTPFIGRARPSLGAVADVFVLALELGLLCHSVAFCISTQLVKRLDSMLWSVMAAAFVCLVCLKSGYKFDPAALAVSAGCVFAAAAALLHGELLDSWKKHAAGVVALAVAGIVGVASVVTLDLVETRLLEPSPAWISSFEVGDDGAVLATVATRDRATNLFQLMDYRVARIDPSTTRSTWLPHRWCQTRTAPRHGRLWVTTVDTLLGYPELPAEAKLVDAKTALPAKPVPGDGEYIKGYYLDEEGCQLTGFASALRRHPEGGEDRLVYAPAGWAIRAFWLTGKSVAVLLKSLSPGGGWTIQLVDENGKELSGRPVPGCEPGMTITPECNFRLADDSTAIWLRQSHPNGAGDSWFYFWTDGARMSWREPTRPTMPGGLQIQCKGGTLVSFIDGKSTCDWQGYVTKYDERGAKTDVLQLGERVRAAEMSISPDGKLAVLKVESSTHDRCKYALLDVATMKLKPILAGIKVPARAAATIHWLDDHRLLYAAQTSIQMVDVDGVEAARTIFWF